MPARLTAGRIVWAEVADPNGIRKLRPAIILRAPDPVAAGGPLDVVAVTSRLTSPLPEDHVLLPWDPRGHPRTGLNRRSAAVCTWLAQIVESDIRDEAGLVPTPLLATILAKVKAASTPGTPAPDAGATPGPGSQKAPPASPAPPAEEDRQEQRP